MKRILILTVALAILFSATACSDGEVMPESPSVPETLVGITMPTTSKKLWSKEGAYLKEALEEKGYEVDLRYAENNSDIQISQIEEMTDKGCDVLIVTPVNSSALTEVLAAAKKNGTTIISYDSLIMNSTDVDYYVAFDYYAVGEMQGRYLADALELDSTEASRNFEVFCGSTDENVDYALYYKGAMDVLAPYVESGKLVCQSGTLDTAVPPLDALDSYGAQIRMDSMLSTNYTSKRIDAVLAQNDSIAQSLAISLLGAGYSPTRPSKLFPYITGQDCEINSIRNMIIGRQSISIFKDPRELAAKAADLTDTLLLGKTPEGIDSESYNNGAKTVNAFLCEPILVTLANYRHVLLDSGYYTAAEISGD